MAFDPANGPGYVDLETGRRDEWTTPPPERPGDEKADALCVARFAADAMTALLAILSLPWPSGGPGISRCPACGVPLGTTPNGHRLDGDHDPDCAWLIAAKACGVA